MTLEWKAFDGRERCSITTCGRYSVSTHNETWQAWRLAPGGPWFARLGINYATEAAAKAAAEQDASRPIVSENLSTTGDSK